MDSTGLEKTIQETVSDESCVVCECFISDCWCFVIVGLARCMVRASRWQTSRERNTRSLHRMPRTYVTWSWRFLRASRHAQNTSLPCRIIRHPVQFQVYVTDFYLYDWNVQVIFYVCQLHCILLSLFDAVTTVWWIVFSSKSHCWDTFIDIVAGKEY